MSLIHNKYSKNKLTIFQCPPLSPRYTFLDYHFYLILYLFPKKAPDRILSLAWAGNPPAEPEIE